MALAEPGQDFVVDPEARDGAPDPPVTRSASLPLLAALREVPPIRIAREKPESLRDPRSSDVAANRVGAAAPPFLNDFGSSHRSPVRVHALSRVNQLRDVRSILASHPVNSRRNSRWRHARTRLRAARRGGVTKERSRRAVAATGAKGGTGEHSLDIALVAARTRRGPTWRATRRRTRGTRSTRALSCAFPASSRTVALVPPGRTRPLNSSARQALTARVRDGCRSKTSDTPRGCAWG